MIPSLTGHTVFACHCKEAGYFFIAGIVIFDVGFVPGVHELWDAANNRYWFEITGTPGTFTRNVEMRIVDAPV